MTTAVPSQEVLQAAIKEAAARRSTGYVSVVDVYQVLPRGQYTFPARSTLVEDTIKVVYPEAKNIGGGVYELGDPDAAQKSQEKDVEEEEDEAEALFGEADLEWTASNGQRVRVWAGHISGLFHVAVDSRLYRGVRFSSVPQEQARAAAKHGVVCKLGPVGLNAERKLACQRIPRHGVNQPIG